MRVLTFNCGSSSVKCAVVDSATGARHFDLRIEDIGRTPAIVTGEGRREFPAATDATAAIDALTVELSGRARELGEVDAVAHRVVHGGENFARPAIIDDAMVGKLASLERLAPLHNPPAIHAIRRARAVFATVPHVAIFDTGFHVTLPRRAREYALPEDIRGKFGVRRYGFHGINHAHVAQRAAESLGKHPQELRVISCHLGSGASVTAIEYGRSVETSMGMTPLEGLVMGTRAGDLDPGLLLELGRAMSPDALDELLNKRAGLTGLTGTGDLREIERRAGEGDEACRLAIALYTHRLRKYIGAYAAVMGGVDAIAFTAGVGEHSALVRHRCVQRFGFLGAVLDEDLNRRAEVDAKHPVADVAAAQSRVRILVVRADEEQAMAAEAAKVLAPRPRPAASVRVPIAVSARHAHLSQPTLERLFGAGYQLRPRKELSQVGQFAAQETVRLIGPRGSIDKVRLMGPPRPHDQVEISRSDEFTLGIDAPVRISGDVANTPGITLEGPQGKFHMPQGVICARRHIHMSPEDAERLGIDDCAIVSVRIDSAGRDLTFNDVSVRVAPQFTLELHLDTDEANAAAVGSGDYAVLVGLPSPEAEIVDHD